MLFSFEKKFVFIANLKTASTSIEELLAPYSDISFRRTSCGKHMSALHASEIINKYAKSIHYEDCFSFGVMRDPLSYALSIYNSHSKVAFYDKPFYTGGLSFDDFLNEWVIERKSWQMKPQMHRFVNANGEPIVDYIISYESLDRGLSYVLEKIGIYTENNVGGIRKNRILFWKSKKSNILKRLNKSPKKASASDVSDWAKQFLLDYFSDDYSFYNKYKDRLLRS